MKNKNKMSELGRFDVLQKIKNFNKKDRTIVVCFGMIILLTATISWLWFGYIPKNVSKYNLSDRNNLTLLNPARNLFNQEDLLINFQPLRDYLNDKYENDPRVSIYFEFLNTGANISISKDAEFFPASLLKLPVAMAVAKKIEDGKWKWSNELVLMSNDKDDLFGTLHKEPIGSRFTLDKLVEKMLVESDNTAYHILLRNLEPEELKDIHKHLGLDKFFSEDGKISAKRYSIIFRSLYNSSYLSEENSQKLLVFLSKTAFKEYLGRALPEDVGFSHKIGVNDEQYVFMDAGLVYVPKRPYILTVMIQAENQDIAKEIMEDVSRKTYEYVVRYDVD